MRSTEFINTYAMWGLYLAHNKELADNCRSRIESFDIQMEYILSRLAADEDRILKYTTIKSVNKRTLDKISGTWIANYFKLKPYYTPPEDFSFEMVSALVRKYNKLRLLRATAKKRLDFNDIKFPYELYAYIVRRFNQLISKAIIKGYCLHPGFGVGNIYILKKDRKIYVETEGSVPARYQINWQETMAYKKQLLAEGKTLKSPENPDGINYFIYHIDPYVYRWQWTKSTCFLPNRSLYCFVPNNSFNVPDRNRISIVKAKMSLEEILDCPQIGNRNKLALAKFAYDEYYIYKPKITNE